MDATQTNASHLSSPGIGRLIDLLRTSSNEGFKLLANDESITVRDEESEIEAVKSIVAEFYKNGYDQSDEFGDDIKKFMADAKCYFEQVASTSKKVEEVASSHEADRRPATASESSPAPFAAGGNDPSYAMKEEWDRLQRLRENEQKAPAPVQEAPRSGPITLDVFGSIWTSFGSFFNANRKAAGAAANYLGDQARVEFGGSPSELTTSPARSIFGGSEKGDDYTRYDSSLEGLELAGRRLEDGRPVNMDAVQRHLNYLNTSMEGAKTEGLSVDDVDRMKKAKDILDEFSERAGKSTQADPDQQKRLEEIVKMAQDIGRTMSEFIAKVVARFKGMIGLSDDGKNGEEAAAAARPRM